MSDDTIYPTDDTQPGSPPDTHTRSSRPPELLADGGQNTGADTDTTAVPAGARQDVLSDDALQRSFPDYQGQIVESRRLPPEPADTVPADDVLRPELAAQMAYDLFTHQAEALRKLETGDNVVTTTSTSSGKTWIYALQAARNHLQDDQATALCLYPMKALSRDQEQELNTKLRDDWGLDLSVGVYDGDTPSDRKRRIRNDCNLIITNPAGLNAYLPRHARDGGWARFYKHLDLVVVDEAHEYTGITGTHVAWILRRLRRVAAHYDSRPQFSMTTATIGNPAAHARRLTGLEFGVVEDDGSPRGRRDIVLWEPPVDWDQVADDDTDGQAAPNGDADQLSDFEDARRSTGSEAAKVTAHLGMNDTQTLQFCSARQGTEIAARQIVDAADSHSRSGRVDAEAYHAGLGKRTRRGVENQLKAGQVDAVASTNALELGIDIGSVGATVTSGYPGTRQSFWQQVGRAGRGESDALSVLVGSTDAMDAYILDNPEYLFSGSVENAVVSIDNANVYADHVLAAAADFPLTDDDASFLGGHDRLEGMVEMWQDAGVLESTSSLDSLGGVVYTGDPRPQSRISMYGTRDMEYVVVCRDGDIDHDPVAPESAHRDYHEGALFLHAGQQYEVVDIHRDARIPRIHVETADTGLYTQTLSQKSISNLQPRDHRSLDGGIDLYFGQGTVDVTYNEYVVRTVSTGELVEGPLPTGSPPLTLHTDLLWVSLPADHIDTTLDRLDEPLLEPTDRAGRDPLVPEGEKRYTYGGGIHAAEHGVIQLAPLELLIDNNDIGGLSMPEHPDEAIPGPVWFVHDGIDGGIGFTRSIFDNFETILRRTREHIAGCDCGQRRGCPMCIMSEDCGNQNDPLDRATGQLIIDDVIAALDSEAGSSDDESTSEPTE
ncbi:DEAD/DEAH box helicase [Halorientalis regularis]|uniref:DEAD/DEAH box helicase domain-containing protein n=1 Tax=Halorientalis regularis TaxID=660518 RepID=A0A1G7SYE1_9EURY|nr:DEAD/DEAH box helicase [Halorientalis regularis]SDG28106.1 DEAD/DEAH box helicase domain-containing protein [Halorientalis regularis]